MLFPINRHSSLGASLVLSSWVVLVCAAGLLAQPKLEISGHVIEPGLRIPIPDATVRLWQYPTDPAVRPEFYNGTALLETQTDATGEFHFTLQESGKYRVATTKAGYGRSGVIMVHDSTAATVTLGVALGSTSELATLELFLARLGSLTGRLVDADTQKPVAKLTLMARQTWYSEGERHTGIGAMTTTGSDGEFAFRNLTPDADYLVTTLPPPSGKMRSLEIAYPPTWWPGGHHADTAVPVRVIANTPLTLGTLEIRKQPVYEARVTVDPESCGGRTALQARIGTDASGYQTLEGIKCGGEFVFLGLLPGTRLLHISTTGDLPASRRRAVTPVVVRTENLKISLSLAPGHTIEGRTLVGSPATPLPPGLSVRLFPLAELPPADVAAAEVNPKGDFWLLNVGPGHYSFAIDNLPPGYCVQEIRHNNTIVRGTTLQVDPYSQAQAITITLSNNPATITGRVLAGDRPLPQAHVRAIAYPLPDGPRRDWRTVQTEADAEGRFSFTNLPSGEYRLIAVTRSDRYTLEEPNVLETLTARAQTLDLQPASAQNITLRATPAKLTY